VLEKLSAKPSRTIALQPRSRASARPSSLSTNSNAANSKVEPTMCTVAAAQTSLRSSVRTSSFRPMVNSSKVTPRFAMVSSIGVRSKPRPLSTKPAARKPISGGRRSSCAPRPATNASAIMMGSIDVLLWRPPRATGRGC
jgi:hypothetical protein